MIDVYDIITKISAKYKEEGKAPCFPLFSDIQAEVTKQVKQEINSLIMAKKLKYHETINSFSFEVLEDNNQK